MDVDGVLVHWLALAAPAPGKPTLTQGVGSPPATGLEVEEKAIWTSALATARFLEGQRPGGTAFVVGESGIATNPDSTGPSPTGPLPATGSVAALITRATGVEPTSSASLTR